MSVPNKLDFQEYIKANLDRIRSARLWRRLRTTQTPQGTKIKIDGHEVVNFSSNDYLGLCNHPLVKEAAIEAISKWGVGAGASRLICGHTQPVEELEKELAAFKNTQAALVFPTGYTAMLGTVCSLFEKGDVLILDRLAHACMIDAARLSGATIRVYAHNDLADLNEKLKWATEHAPSGKIGILTESVFSMDGDTAPLEQILELKEKYGAILILDEAHATGVIGPQGRGLAHAYNLADRIEIQMGTLSKAIGVLGGFICGSQALIDLLVNRARPFIFTTGTPPALAAAACAALRIIQSPEGDSLRRRLYENVRELCSLLGLPPQPSAIIPVILGDEEHTVKISNCLLERGFYVPAVRYPAVKRGAARLRISVCANHTPGEIQALASNLKELLRKSN